jgi:serpin B
MKRSLLLPCIIPIAMSLNPSCSSTPNQAQEIQSDVSRELSPQVADSDLAELIDGNGDFAFALYKEISSGEGNLFYSPYSISVALAMTYTGARNQTADQMAQALHFTLPQERLHPAFNKLALELASRSQAEGLKPEQAFQLNIANSLWGQEDFHFESDFLDALAGNYSAGMHQADFTADPEAARIAINDWVSRETKEKIKDIVQKGDIKTITRLVLANAVYFKAAWQNPFEPDATQPGVFYLLDGSKVDVPMMRETAGLNTMQGDGYRAVELPYAGGQLSMLILLPEEGRFEDVEDRLDVTLLDATIAALEESEVNLALPKFKFEWTAEKLPEDFQHLGMTDAFSSAADFSGMTGSRDLYISNILHKAFVAVDEAGTEAAAATVVIMDKALMPISTELEINRPFFFLIRDNPTGTILFLGRVTNPIA